MEKIILVGGGGHFRSVVDTLNGLYEFEIIGIIDSKEKIGCEVSGVRIVGSDEDIEFFLKKGVQNAFVSLGSIGETGIRTKLYKNLKRVGFKLPIVIDKSAIVSANVHIGEGTFIGKGAIINSGVNIGKMCIINTGAIIDHDCRIEDYVHIAPGTVLSGGVDIGINSHIGTGATVINNKTIGGNTIVGAGSVVIDDMESNVICYGNPCRKIRENQNIQR